MHTGACTVVLAADDTAGAAADRPQNQYQYQSVQQSRRRIDLVLPGAADPRHRSGYGVNVGATGGEVMGMGVAMWLVVEATLAVETKWAGG